MGELTVSATPVPSQNLLTPDTTPNAKHPRLSTLPPDQYEDSQASLKQVTPSRPSRQISSSQKDISGNFQLPDKSAIEQTEEAWDTTMFVNNDDSFVSKWGEGAFENLFSEQLIELTDSGDVSKDIITEGL